MVQIFFVTEIGGLYCTKLKTRFANSTPIYFAPIALDGFSIPFENGNVAPCFCGYN